MFLMIVFREMLQKIGILVILLRGFSFILVKLEIKIEILEIEFLDKNIF